MRLLGTGLLTDLIQRVEAQNPAEGQILRGHIKAWRKIVQDADWSNPGDVRRQIRSADPVGKNRIVFNIAGNKYRLVVLFNYEVPAARVRFAGTHTEYDAIADIRKV